MVRRRQRWCWWCDCLNYIEWVIISSLILSLYPKAICSVLKWFIAYITIQRTRTKQVIRWMGMYGFVRGVEICGKFSHCMKIKTHCDFAV